MKEKTALTFYNMVNDVLKFMNDLKIQHIINENIDLDDSQIKIFNLIH